VLFAPPCFVRRRHLFYLEDSRSWRPRRGCVSHRGIPLDQLSVFRAYEQQMSSGSSLWVIPQAVQAPRQFAILGFLTGFGLSAAIGAVLYICLVAG